MNTPAKLLKTIVLFSSLVYIIAVLIVVLKRDAVEAKNTIRSVDSSLGVHYTPLNIASECGFNDFKAALFDFHVFSHFFGWFITTLALRDVGFCWVSGAIWEIVEGSVSDSIPDLKECWWDKIFLDLLGANNLGIFLGWIIIRLFKMEEFNWAGTSNADGRELHQAGILYFLPGGKHFSQNHYGAFKTVRSAFVYLYVHFVIMILQLQFFLMKGTFWIPTLHWLCIYRSFVIGSLCALTAQILKKPTPDLSGFPLLLNLALALEGLMVIRFGGNMLITPNGNATAAIVMVLSNVGLWAATMRDIGNLWSGKYKQIKNISFSGKGQDINSKATKLI